MRKTKQPMQIKHTLLSQNTSDYVLLEDRGHKNGLLKFETRA